MIIGMTIAVICLAVALAVSATTIVSLLDKNSALQKELAATKEAAAAAKEAAEKEHEIFGIAPGDTGIIKDFSIVNTNPKRNPVEIAYKVTFEVTILEVAKDSVKVTATGYTSFDKFARDSANRPGIIQFMTEKWVSKDIVEIVADANKRRDRILSDLGI
jgi:hypothetical protein